MTDSVRAASRHYDQQLGLCKAPDDDSSEARSVSSAREQRMASSPASQKAADDSSTLTKGAQHLAANVSAKQPVRSDLCERRLRTNDLLCKILGGAVALRAPGAAKIFAPAVAGECVHAWKWLEENAPGGACGDD